MNLQIVQQQNMRYSHALERNTMAHRRRPPGSLIPTRSGSFSAMSGRQPRPGVDYPSDDAEFTTMCAGERECRQLIERLRYPAGFDCEACGSREAPWRSGTGLIACVRCRQPVQLTAGTIFHGSCVPLKRWLSLMWEMTARDGVDLERAKALLGVSEDAVAREHLGRVRQAMARPSLDNPLGGVVTLSVARLVVDDMPRVVALAIQDGGDRARVRLRHLRRVKSGALLRFAQEVIEPGTQVRTSGLRGFAELEKAGFAHRVVASPEPQRLSSLLELWLWSRVPSGERLLQPYLDEFAFRYDRRVYPPGLLFYRLALLAAKADDPRAAVSEDRIEVG